MTHSPGVVQNMGGRPRKDNCVGQRMRMLAEAGRVSWGQGSRAQLIDADVDSSEALNVIKVGSVTVTKSDPSNQRFGCSVRAELRDGRVIALAVRVCSRWVVVEAISLEAGQ